MGVQLNTFIDPEETEEDIRKEWFGPHD